MRIPHGLTQQRIKAILRLSKQRDETPGIPGFDHEPTKSAQGRKAEGNAIGLLRLAGPPKKSSTAYVEGQRLVLVSSYPTHTHTTISRDNQPSISVSILETNTHSFNSLSLTLTLISDIQTLIAIRGVASRPTILYINSLNTFHTYTTHEHHKISNNAPHNSFHGPCIPPVRHRCHPNGEREANYYILRVQVSHLALELCLGFAYPIAQPLRGVHMPKG